MPPCSLSHVCVGGSFDRLHDGHRILLTMAAATLKPGGRLVVGVSGDPLLRRKELRELIAPATLRLVHVLQFCRSLRPDIIFEAVNLQDAAGPAAWDPKLEGIVVSAETAGGAAHCNQRRQEAGLGPLAVYTTEIYSPSGLALDPAQSHGLAAKMSSSALRGSAMLHVGPSGAHVGRRFMARRTNPAKHPYCIVVHMSNLVPSVSVSAQQLMAQLLQQAPQGKCQVLDMGNVVMPPLAAAERAKTQHGADMVFFLNSKPESTQGPPPQWYHDMDETWYLLQQQQQERLPPPPKGTVQDTGETSEPCRDPVLSTCHTLLFPDCGEFADQLRQAVESAQHVSTTTLRDFPAESLPGRWLRLCSWAGLEDSDSVVFQWWAVIRDNMSQPSRSYHDLTHLEAMFHYLDELERLPGGVQDSHLVQFAVFFHDVIYDATRSDNEAASARLFESFCHLARGAAGAAWALSLQDEGHVVAWIERTAKHLDGPAVGPLAQFLDMDLAVLGLPLPRYLRYAEYVRKEYHHYEDLAFLRGRARVLTGFLSAGCLYFSPAMAQHLESQARTNLAFEIEQLQRLAGLTVTTPMPPPTHQVAAAAPKSVEKEAAAAEE